MRMHAMVGERIVIHGRQVGSPDRHGTISEVRGADGAPPYVVRFDDGHEGLIYPGPDCSLKRSDLTRSDGEMAAAGE